MEVVPAKVEGHCIHTICFTAHHMQTFNPTRSLPAALGSTRLLSNSARPFTSAQPPARQHRAASRRQHRAAPPAALFGRLFGGAAKMAPGKSLEEAKTELLDCISTLKRGVAATDADKAQVDALAQVRSERGGNLKCREAND